MPVRVGRTKTRPPRAFHVSSVDNDHKPAGWPRRLQTLSHQALLAAVMDMETTDQSIGSVN